MVGAIDSVKEGRRPWPGLWLRKVVEQLGGVGVVAVAGEPIVRCGEGVGGGN